MRRRLAIQEIRLDFQPAENLIEDNVLYFLDLLRSGKTFEPVTVRFDGESYFLQDGFHRLEATRRAALSTIVADVSPGTLAEMETEFQQVLERVKASLKPQDSKSRSKRVFGTLASFPALMRLLTLRDTRNDILWRKQRERVLFRTGWGLPTCALNLLDCSRLSPRMSKRLPVLG